jgi:uncharacterized cupin superfamily protein
LITDSGFFDKRYYYRHNPTVKSQGINPVIHYLLYGADKGRNPGPLFDTAYYVEKYPMVREGNLNALIHYIKRGREEGKLPFRPEDYPSDRLHLILNDIYQDNESGRGNKGGDNTGMVTMLREHILAGTEALKTQAIRLRLPQDEDTVTGWKSYPAFRGRTPNLDLLSCHTSVLSRGKCPHPPHGHKEEEILIMLWGEAEIILEDAGGNEQRRKIRPGQFAYYPGGFKHTIENSGEGNANYLMFKWFVMGEKRKKQLPFLFIDELDPFKSRELDRAFTAHENLKGPTRYCKKIQSHTSYMLPGGGYGKHGDHHDVAIIILEGEVVTNGREAAPFDVVFYPAGELHDMYNKNDKPAKYLVFEFHN